MADEEAADDSKLKFLIFDPYVNYLIHFLPVLPDCDPFYPTLIYLWSILPDFDPFFYPISRFWSIFDPFYPILIHFLWLGNDFWSILNLETSGLQGQAEKMLNETKEKVSEYTEAAMEKVNNCKVS